MLSIMRRHVGWGLKVILGIVIVSFVFFFGYNAIRQQGADQVALEVGNEDIPFARYQFIYNQQYQNFADKFQGGEMPDFVVNSIRQTTQRLLVQRSLAKQFAEQLGLEISDSELAAFIMKDKDFDPVSYKNFIQYFYRQNGFAYEEVVREDLLLQKFQDWAKKIGSETPSPLADIQWAFETLILEGEDKKVVAEKIQSAWAKGENAAALLASTKTKTQKVGPVGFGQRHELFSGQLDEKEYLQLFASAKPTAPAHPFIKGNRSLLARVTAVTGWDGGKTKLPTAGPQTHLIDLWFQNFANQTKVESHIPAEPL